MKVWPNPDSRVAQTGSELGKPRQQPLEEPQFRVAQKVESRYEPLSEALEATAQLAHVHQPESLLEDSEPPVVHELVAESRQLQEAWEVVRVYKLPQHRRWPLPEVQHLEQRSEQERTPHPPRPSLRPVVAEARREQPPLEPLAEPGRQPLELRQ